MTFVYMIGLALAQTEIAPTEPSTLPPVAFRDVVKLCDGQERCEGLWGHIKYRLYDSGSAYFEPAGTDTSWEFNCRVDSMNDSRTCILSGRRGSYVSEKPYLMALWGDGWSGVAVGVAHGASAYPGTEELLRVDKNPAFSVDEDGLFSGARAAAIVQQLKRGKSVKLRFYDWPYNDPHDSEVDLTGFTLVWEAVTELRHTAD